MSEKLSWRVVELHDLVPQIQTLWSRVQEATGDPRLRGVVAALYQREELPARDNRALARSVQRMVQTHIKFVKEKPETYVHPVRTLSWRIGDCDDQATVVASMLRGCGIPCRLAFVGTDKGTGQTPISPGHVYTEAQLDPKRDEWTALETVRAVPMGWDAPAQWRKKGWRTVKLTHGDKPGSVTL